MNDGENMKWLNKTTNASKRFKLVLSLQSKLPVRIWLNIDVKYSTVKITTENM